MTIFPSFFVNTTGGGGGGAYEIEQSLRFNSDDSAYLTRTVSTNGNRRTFTISFWYKKGKNSRRHAFYGAGDTAVNPGGGFWFRLDTQERLVAQAGGGGTTVGSADLFRDHSAWYHFVCAVDTTQATTTDRIKLYVNGRQISDFDTSFILYPAQNFEYEVNSTSASQQIGRANDSGTFQYYVDGHVAEYHLLDGTQATASDFGEPDDNGVWRPIEYTGSYGTNGFYLKFDPSATNGIGHDHSGNGNNWTANNFTTSGTGTDVMDDTPTNNWCTGNPLAVTSGDGVWTSGGGGNGNLSAYCDNTRGGLVTIPCPNSGKWYCEITPTTSTASGGRIGLSPTSNTRWVSNNGDFSDGTYNGYAYDTSGNKVTGGTSSSYGASYGANDVIGIAFDAGGGTLTFYKNGTSQGTAFTSISTNENWVFAFRGASGSNFVVTLNFGQRAFEYTPPTGFNALNTANLPAPDIADGSDYFKPLIYLPDGSSSFSVTGVGFQPDFTWIKSRNYAEDHQLNDAVRGATKALQSNLTSGETTQSNGLTSFDSDGFTVGNLSDYNYSGDSIISWNWLAGGSGSSNTDGSITSTVSANPTAGFSIVTYTGAGTGATVGHGLGITPELLLVKNRTTSFDWAVYHSALGGTKYLDLNTTDQAVTASGRWSDTDPTNTVFSVDSSNATGNASGNYVAYCFAEVEGYSKFGSYTGNGSSDGPAIWCGFRPAWVLTKRTDSTSAWYLHDTVRNTYNVANLALSPDLSDAEVSANNNLDILSNGFKLRTSGAWMNASGGTYVFAAFAEHPTGGDGVSPATAR